MADQIPVLYQAELSVVNRVWDSLSPAMQQFLPNQKFVEAISDLNSHTSSMTTFKQRFFYRFDGFFAFKFANYARTQHYVATPIEEAAIWLLSHVYNLDCATQDVKDLLIVFRGFDKGNKE